MVRVSPSPRRLSLVLAASTATIAMALAGCSADGDKKEAGSSSSGSPTSGSSTSGSSTSGASSSASPSPASTVAVPDGAELTDEGSELRFGASATVIFESAPGKGSVLELTVKRVRKGRLTDFKSFILDDPYKQKASYYYVAVRVKNVGEGVVGGVRVPLWGVNGANTLLPPVKFTTPFTQCPSKLLPESFGPGASLATCLVYLSPDRGSLDAVSYRPSTAFDAITWTGEISTPSPTPTKKAKPKTKKKKG